MKISRHLARYEQFKWPYLAKPVLVRELNQGTIGPGSQTITWDGLDQNGQMVVEEQNTSTKELAAMNLWTSAYRGTAYPATAGQSLPDLGCGRSRDCVHQL